MDIRLSMSVITRAHRTGGTANPDFWDNVGLRSDWESIQRLTQEQADMRSEWSAILKREAHNDSRRVHG
jgi:hypothetical protein